MKKDDFRNEIALKVEGETDRGKRLVRMVDQLVRYCENPSGPEIACQLLSDIQKSFDEYFKVEESYMQKNHDPDLSVHREQHRLFMENLVGYSQEITREQGQISIEFCNYLVEWLNFHFQNLNFEF